MFSEEMAASLAECLFYLTKLHGFQPSEVLNMTYTDYRVTLNVLSKHLQEEQRRYSNQVTPDFY